MPKTHRIVFEVTPEQRKELRIAALHADKTLSLYVKDVLFGKPPKPEFVKVEPKKQGRRPPKPKTALLDAPVSYTMGAPGEDGWSGDTSIEDIINGDNVMGVDDDW